MTLQLDMIQTVAFAAGVLFIGYGIRRHVGVLDRFNIPAPVVGGFLFALIALVLRQTEALVIAFDTTMQVPFMVAFFTTIGLGASFRLLKRGGPQVILFWILASVLAALQCGLGLGIAKLMGVDPLLGLIAGSITMTGGHGTGAAFGALIEERYALQGAVTVAMAAATFGLVAGGLLGGPVGTRLLNRNNLRSEEGADNGSGTAPAVHSLEIDNQSAGEAPSSYRLLQTIGILLGCMAVGGLLSKWLGQHFTLPSYIGSMIVAVIVRNACDFTRVLRISTRVVDDLGMIALSLFLTMALMSLKLWELAGLAGPMMVIVVAQVAMMGLFAYHVTYRVMGRDYDAAIMAGGHCGFGLGATPNAVANMTALTERFGPAHRAFLVLPMVGAFFIDFSNALIITTYINFLQP